MTNEQFYLLGWLAVILLLASAMSFVAALLGRIL